GDTGNLRPVPVRPEDMHATDLCAEAMRHAVVVAGEVAAVPEALDQAAQSIAELEQCATSLRALQPVHRRASLSSAAAGGLSAEEAMRRVDAVRRLDALTYHAWRAAARLVGQ